MKRGNEKRHAAQHARTSDRLIISRPAPGPIDPMKYESPRNEPRITNDDALILVLNGNRRRTLIIINTRLNLSFDGRLCNPINSRALDYPYSSISQITNFRSDETTDPSQSPKEFFRSFARGASKWWQMVERA